jgi:hypothetical protein
MPEETRTSPKIKTESIVAFAAIFVSIATLLVYLYQARIMQKQQHTSVWPYVEWLYNNDRDQLYITVENKGIGPALVKSVKLELDGKVMGSNSEFFKTLLGNSNFNFVNSTVQGRVISPGEKVELFHIYDSSKARAVDSLLLWNSSKHEFRLSICYCSVYGDCWTTDGSTNLESECK